MSSAFRKFPKEISRAFSPAALPFRAWRVSVGGGRFDGSVHGERIETVIALAQGEADVVGIGEVGDGDGEGVVVLADAEGLALHADLQLDLGEGGGGDVGDREGLLHDATHGVAAVGVGGVEVGEDAPDVATAGVGDDLVHGAEAAVTGGVDGRGVGEDEQGGTGGGEGTTGGDGMVSGDGFGHAEADVVKVPDGGIVVTGDAGVLLGDGDAGAASDGVGGGDGGGVPGVAGKGKVGHVDLLMQIEDDKSCFRRCFNATG